MLEIPSLTESTPQSSPMPLQQETPLWQKLLFVLAVWGLSRALIVFVMQIVAPWMPLTPAQHAVHPMDFPFPYRPSAGWELFTHWDGKWYERIATRGYEYGADYATQRYSVGFPPMFPLVCAGVMAVFQLPFAIAAPAINNLAFLVALVVLYLWVEQWHGMAVARWSAIALAWCPYSLYTTLAYTEGLFLLMTSAALYAFDHKRYGWMTLCGAIATMTRFFGTALIPALLIAAWRQRRSAIAYLAALGIGVGWLTLLLYCGWKFGDPFAPFHAQIAWSVEQETWRHVFAKLILRRGLTPDTILKIVMFFGGGYLIWRWRDRLSWSALAYGFCYMGVLFAAQSTFDISRYSYANCVLAIAAGLMLATQPQWRLPILILCSVKLIEITIRFTWWYSSM